jgi:DNA polymerase III epsilon subunit-like protein
MMDVVIDIETDGIQATKVHCMVADEVSLTLYDEMRAFFGDLEPSDSIVGHNFQRYDKPTLERILGIQIKAQIVDTLALSWYLYPEAARHGLADWGEYFGVPKPVIDDWENLSTEEYLHRCKEDVRINTLLWEKIQEDLLALYGSEEGVQHLVRYLAFKMQCAEQQEHDRWAVDVEAATTLLDELQTAHSASTSALEAVMPRVPKMAWRNRPAKPFKNDGTRSDSGLKWDARCAEHNVPTSTDRIRVQIGTLPPRPGGTVQVKKWLFSLGWVPCTFKYDGEKGIPQVKDEDELCPSVKRMIPLNPELQHLEMFTIHKHRIDVLKALLDAQQGGFVKAEIQGLTNTLRFKHRKPCANIPSPRKQYGAEIRALFIARRDDTELVGADMCSLEDRTKQHYLWDYDPEYVQDMMQDDFDPHLDLAESSGAVTRAEVLAYKAGDHTVSDVRHLYKGGNYACTYGSGVRGLARQLGVSTKVASGIHKVYWERNWSIKAVSKNTITKSVQGKLWLWNPVSELWYSLRNEKDIFSTLNQGTGVYCFDLWVHYIQKERKQLTAQFHDEIILEVHKGRRDQTVALLKRAVQKVNSTLKLNRELDVDVQFGNNYSEVH